MRNLENVSDSKYAVATTGSIMNKFCCALTFVADQKVTVVSANLQTEVLDQCLGHCCTSLLYNKQLLYAVS